MTKMASTGDNIYLDSGDSCRMIYTERMTQWEISLTVPGAGQQKSASSDLYRGGLEELSRNSKNNFQW